VKIPQTKNHEQSDSNGALRINEKEPCERPVIALHEPRPVQATSAFLHTNPKDEMIPSKLPYSNRFPHQFKLSVPALPTTAFTSPSVLMEAYCAALEEITQ
jgi:hypothetical protein